MYKTDMFHV